jgi:hypothetical protein
LFEGLQEKENAMRWVGLLMLGVPLPLLGLMFFLGW